MKKITLIAALLTVMSAALFAKEGKGIKILNDSSAVFKVYYSKPVASKVKVNIYNDKGDKVFAESIKNVNGFVRPYNMSALPSGTYTFEISDKTEVETFEFTYAESEVEHASMTANIVRLDQGRFFLGVSSDKSDKVQIEVFNDKDELVYRAIEVVANQFGQLYNLQSVESNGFTITVRNNEEVIKEITL